MADQRTLSPYNKREGKRLYLVLRDGTLDQLTPEELRVLVDTGHRALNGLHMNANNEAKVKRSYRLT